ncbi:hypothetical protein HDG34_003282 [Paraburkholderia sp. HC6.4b]|uniref:hypothetical protein n=1 Tax=unclassified Paraburkholderia TaxID=2615204 RepID=UPI00160FA74F|nr:MULTISPECIES: hypothetical protein [unclassified Paraburkholderia]MBB5409341.1 hypothetical protein [Paraburkholderia sp. HC6.4b]MBB5451069.1 hypothetical protein [Paraburkholderia sp. Kb1A]
MHTLFNLSPRSLQGIQVPGAWHAIRDGLRRNLGQVIRYYRHAPGAVKSSHPLVKLVQSVDVPLSLALERYHANVDAMALNLSMAMKMTSSIFRGKVWNGEFYGAGHDEILVVHTEYFDLALAHRDWRNATPLRVLRHARSDLEMNLPDGHFTGSETGMAVIAINLPMLMVQYRAFREEEKRSAGRVDEKSVTMFVHRFVLPNMLFSQLDQTLLNRIRRLQARVPAGWSTRKHPFALADYSVRLDHCYEEILVGLTRQRKNFIGVLQSVPVAAHHTLEEAMHLPDMAPTRQVMWALAIARLPMLDFVLGASGDTPGTLNQSEINLLNRTFLGWQQERLFEGVMNALTYQAVLDEFDAIRHKANPVHADSTSLA